METQCIFNDVYQADHYEYVVAPRHGKEALWGERKHSSYSLLTSALDGVSGQRHASAAI
jgi:hypothetical protein